MAIGTVLGGGLGLLPAVAAALLLDVRNNPGPHGAGPMVLLVGMLSIPFGAAVGAVVGGIVAGRRR
jgi:hypothetical protein